jgi:hypothetical protein
VFSSAGRRTVAHVDDVATGRAADGAQAWLELIPRQNVPSSILVAAGAFGFRTFIHAIERPDR